VKNSGDKEHVWIPWQNFSPALLAFFAKGIRAGRAKWLKYGLNFFSSQGALNRATTKVGAFFGKLQQQREKRGRPKQTENYSTTQASCSFFEK
jgi:hypothetical protein